MSGISPIPTTRVGDFFVRQQLVGQVQQDQLDLFKLQSQVSTGRRIQLPSEDALAALRAINLQRLLARKGQIRTNLQASNSYIDVAWAKLTNLSDPIADLRAAALEAAGTVAPESSRLAAIQKIDGLLAELVDTGNAKFQGRYLFAGSRAQVQPYEYNGGFVEYRGNEGVLRSYVDLRRLFETNVSGPETFGGISTPVQGSVDLNPHLTPNTLLSSVNRGNGISRNAAVTLSVNTGITTVSSVVDLSRAVTIGDVARLIELGAPAGTSITAVVTGAGLTLSTSSGTIAVSEVAEGRAARELGIFTPAGSPPSATITGTDLNPKLLKTTPLANLLGTKAQGRIVSSGLNNDIVITAAQNGSDLNGVTVEFVAGGVAGSESVSYDAFTKTLTVQVEDGISSARQVAAAITADGRFNAQFDYRDATSTDQAGSGAVEIANFGVLTSGGSGEVLDTTSGLILSNGGQTVTLDVSSAETVEDLLNRIMGSQLGFLAEINAAGNGINIRSRLSGADFTIGENGGTTATQLGIRSYTASTKLADLNRGVGVPTSDLQDDALAPFTSDLLITARDGTALTVNLATATTLQDVVTLINSAPGNGVGTTSVSATLNADGHGIQLVDTSTPITGDLIVLGNQASEYLGFLAAGQPQISADAADGYSLGSYRHSQEDDFLIRARDGTELWVDLTGAKNVQQVIDRINSHPRNTNGTAVTARLAAVGNGIELVDSSSLTTGSLTVQVADGSQAARYLGFVPEGQTQVSDNTPDGSGNFVLQSEDRHTLETDSIFNTLLRLRTALQQGNVEEIGRSVDRLDADTSRINFAVAELGIRSQSLAVVDIKLQDENVQLQSALSNDLDVDLIEAISNLTARQYAFEASLRTAASLLQLSLLNFI